MTICQVLYSNTTTSIVNIKQKIHRKLCIGPLKVKNFKGSYLETFSVLHYGVFVFFVQNQKIYQMVYLLSKFGHFHFSRDLVTLMPKYGHKAPESGCLPIFFRITTQKLTKINRDHLFHLKLTMAPLLFLDYNSCCYFLK